jgi:ABC-2 type transport system ATP-binding protein
MVKEYALEVHNIHKSFKLPSEKAGKLKTALINRLRGVKGYKEQHVLRGIDFNVKKGEFLGIVGRNGSGKSTLLKIISEIYQPTSGEVKVHGKLVPFIELGVGFNPELTGRENVYLNGALLGFSNKEVDSMYDEIVEFAELGEFMGQKLKNYSSGMQVRLAFSVAIQAKSDILVLDEVLAVGDEAFQRKCYAYFAKIKKEKKTVILVTHSMDTVQQFCDSAILIEDGKITIHGEPARAAQRYRMLNMSNASINHDGSSDNEFVRVYANADVDYQKNKVYIKADFMAFRSLEDIALTITINRDSGEFVYRWVSDEKIGGPLNLQPEEGSRVELELDNIFADGEYEINVGVKKVDRSVDYLVTNRITSFEISHKGSYTSDNLWKPKEKFSLRKTHI